MNSLDIILYIVGAAALFLLFTAGYALGHKDGKREGYTLGRSISRNDPFTQWVLDSAKEASK
jgi:hypothetical protein